MSNVKKKKKKKCQMFVYSGHALSYTKLVYRHATRTAVQIKHNIVKNPNWPEADQLAIYKCGRGFELGRSVKQIQLVARAGLEPGTAGLRGRRTDHSATLPPPLMKLDMQ